jgi:FkbM family methyltransferase
MFSVKQKILIARQLNRTLRVVRRISGRGMTTVCRRRGITWNLNLDEGIDLAIYLLGAYEAGALRAYHSFLKPGAVVFDIGANIGAHTLHFARLVAPTGRVHAFEPTDFACAKLRANLASNPSFASTVVVNQIFLVAEPNTAMPAEVCASWPVDSIERTLDEGHLGQRKTLAAAHTMTADEYARTMRIARLDFVKIDIDGHEFSVLQGFRGTLARFRPMILIEIAPFIYDDINSFDNFVRFLADLGYDFYDVNTGRAIPSEGSGLRALIRPGASINALLRPRPQ